MRVLLLALVIAVSSAGLVKADCPAADLNGDCRVDELDMALLEENWLQDNSLTEDWYEID